MRSKGSPAFWEGRTLATVTRETCRAYARARGRSAGTVRRELGVLRAAINHAHREGRVTRAVAVHLPERPEPKDRWLTPPGSRRRCYGPRGREPKVQAPPAALHPDGPLHRAAQRGPPVAALGSGRPRYRANQLQPARPAADQQAPAACADRAAAAAASSAGAPSRC